MRLFVVLSIFLLHTQAVQAQSFIVKKTKGKQALIEITSGKLDDGAEYSLSTTDKAHTKSSRKHLIGVDGLLFSLGSYSSTTNGSTSTRTTADLKSYFGWNFEKFEVGPVLLLTTTSGGVQTSTFSLGGFLDYNFKENKTGESFITGLLSSMLLNSQDAGGSKTTGYTIDLGYFLKWYPINEWLCIRTNFKLEYTEIKNDVTTTKTAAFIVNTGLASYF